MADGLSIEVENLQRVMEQLTALQHTGKNKALRKGLRKGGNYLKKQSRAKLKKEGVGEVTGNLKSSFVVKVKRGNTGVLVGFNQKGHHAHLIDRGHQVVSHGVVTGYRTKARPFQTSTRYEDMPRAAKIATEGIYEMLAPYQ